MLKRLLKIFGSVVGGLGFFPGIVSAEYTIPQYYRPTLAPDLPTGGTYEEKFVSLFLQFLAGNLLYFAGAVAVLLLIWAGAQYVTAMGNESGMEKAKKAIQWVLIGLAAMILSFAIVRFVITFFLGLPESAPEPQTQSQPSTGGSAGGAAGNKPPAQPAPSAPGDYNLPKDTGTAAA